MNFSQNLKKLRQERNITQQKLAEDIFVSRSTVAKWENGLGMPSDVNLKALCEYFSVSEEELISRKELKSRAMLYGAQRKNIGLASVGLVLCVLFCFSLRLRIFEQRIPEGFASIMLFPRSMSYYLGAWAVLPVFLWLIGGAFFVCSFAVERLRNSPKTTFFILIAVLTACIIIFLVTLLTSTVIASKGGFVLLF